jgi:D-amino peptidase
VEFARLHRFAFADILPGMRVLIMSDMEGVSGIVKWAQVNGGAAMYEEGRRLYTEEINAAVRGAKAAGATEIVAVDCHGAGGIGRSTRSCRR